MSDNVISVNDDGFESEVLKSDMPVLVDFWAAWCGPCKMIAPYLDDIAKEYAGKIKIAKVNIDENSITPANYNVRGIPTLLLFKEGEVVDTKVGAVSRTQLAEFIDQQL
ncbi:MAG: thioredoxin TrxA [Gammaproteobacteria bacterium]